MDHGMAVGTYRTKIQNRIYDVLTTDLCERAQVVHMNHAFSCGTVNYPEVNAADAASSAVMLQAKSTCLGVSLVGVDGDLNCSTFDKAHVVPDFFRQRDTLVSDPAQCAECLGQFCVHYP